MPAQHDEVGREMERLLTAMTEGTLDAGGRRRLGKLIRDDDAARRLYLDYCQMHAMLKSAHGELTAVAPERSRKRWFAWIVSGVAAALVLATSLVWVWYRDNRAASVVAIRGEVSLVSGGNAQPAKVGMALGPGQGIHTGTDGGADLQLADGSTIQLSSSTRMRLQSAAEGHAIELKAGGMACDVRPQPRGKPLVLVAPHAEVTVLGTAFELTAAPVATSVQVTRGRVRVAGAGGTIELTDGQRATADAQGIRQWAAVCSIDFRGMQSPPPQFQTVFCDTQSLHAARRNIVSAPNGIQCEPGGLRFVDPRPVFGEHGLIVSRWAEEIGGDVTIEAEVSAGEKWSLGLAVDGDSFEGYRIIFAVPEYPNGITIDSFHPSGQTLLAQDPRPIPFERDHTLRVEKLGQRIRVWVDREIRIDTELSHPLAKDRRRTVAISNFGASPLIRSLRVWQAMPPSP